MSIEIKGSNFFLDGKTTTYAFCVNRHGYVEHLYFGKKIAHDDMSYIRTHCRGGFDSYVMGDNGEYYSYGMYAPEFAFGLTGDYREPTFSFINEKGDRTSEMLYVSHEITVNNGVEGMPSLRGGERLVVHLEDKINKIGADLYYTVYDDSDAIARNIVYRNLSGEEIRLNRAYSFTLALPEKDYKALSLYGAWANERNEQYTPLQYGVISVDSKRTSSSAVSSPFTALVKDSTTEETGEAIGINLIYSSSFVLKAEVAPNGDSLVMGGINDYDFEWVLAPGESFATPQAVIVYSACGLGGMSRTFHDVYREHLINPGFVHKTRPVVINNWEATYFNFTPEKLKAIIDAVEGTGIDTFVLDDGWFGHKRDDDKSALGDWFVNYKKLPGGIKEISDYAHEKGLRFGLWFEPEMISPDSDLYRAHPDWVIAAPGRTHTLSRHQCVLDITRQEVRDYVVDIVNKAIRDNKLDYVKWDSNRYVTECYSFALEAKHEREFSHRYALGLYDICERIVNGNPDVLFEGCSGGGSRFDAGMIYYFPQIWTSDTSDAEARTFIQYSTSYAYPLSTMSCHVSACPNHQTQRTEPYETRAAIAHLGATGYELDTSVWTDEDKEMVKKQVADYKNMQDLVLNGDLYRLDNPFNSNYFTFNIVSKDKKRAVCTEYRRHGGANMKIHRVYFRGLDESKTYRIAETGQILSGSVLVNFGIIGFGPGKGDYLAKVYHIEEVNQVI